MKSLKVVSPSACWEKGRPDVSQPACWHLYLWVGLWQSPHVHPSIFSQGTGNTCAGAGRWSPHNVSNKEGRAHLFSPRMNEGVSTLHEICRLDPNNGTGQPSFWMSFPESRKKWATCPRSHRSLAYITANQDVVSVTQRSLEKNDKWQIDKHCHIHRHVLYKAMRIQNLSNRQSTQSFFRGGTKTCWRHEDLTVVSCPGCGLRRPATLT